MGMMVAWLQLHQLSCRLQVPRMVVIFILPIGLQLSQAKVGGFSL